MFAAHTMLKWGPSVLRAKAAASLGAPKNPMAIRPLVEALRDKSPAVRVAAARSLGEIGAAEARDPIVAVLGDAQWQVRQTAVEALGQIGGAETVATLIDVLADADVEVRIAAVASLEKLASPQSVSALFARGLDDPIEEVRTAALAAVARFAGAVSFLVPKLSDPDARVRAAAARALGETSDPSVIALLAVRLVDEADPVRKAVVSALGALHWAPTEIAQRVTFALVAEREADIVAQGEAAVGPLLAHLKTPSPWIRRRAVELLGKLNSGQAIEPLTSVLQNEGEDSPVRDAAELVLRQSSDPRARQAIRALDQRRAEEGKKLAETRRSAATSETVLSITGPKARPLLDHIRRGGYSLPEAAATLLAMQLGESDHAVALPDGGAVATAKGERFLANLYVWEVDRGIVITRGAGSPSPAAGALGPLPRVTYVAAIASLRKR